MKKFTLILAAVFCFATAAVNAQTYVGDIQSSEFYTIPGAFTNNGHAYVVFATYLGDYHYNYSIYQSDFTTHVTDFNNLGEVYLGYIDCDSYSEDAYLIFTQKLFNTDSHFEYVEHIYDVYYDTVYYDPENYWIQEREFTKTIIIKSTNGSTLWSFDAEEGYQCECYCFKLDNKYYLLVYEGENYHESYGYDYQYDRRNHLYLISQGQGLTEVKTDLPISVFPSIANRHQQITVELGEGNNAKEVTVVNSLGQVIKRVPVQEGQRQITIPAQELNSGLNVVNTRTEHGQGSCKIIVR